MTSVVAPKSWLSPFDGLRQKNYRHTKPPQTHIAFIMPCFKGIGSCHKSGTGKIRVEKTTPRGNRCFNCSNCHSKSNYLSLPVISVNPPLNNSVINPSHLSSVGQQSSISSHNTPHDNWCFNSKDSKSKSNEFPSLVIPVPHQLNDSVINPTHMPLVFNSHADIHISLLVITSALIARTLNQRAISFHHQ